ncbi:outer membrane beta-barrel protein [Yersinia rochesterensis]|uniref:Ail/Lom family outer membrane beta-barrel protein n=1 Tax=Yersinia TaxID=629 RepID=UPI0022404850|nr:MULTISPECIES: Ail/Lom family outer membrane beta-barrel protein [Yersinia]MDA5543796.1 outer membrane beta-barrel protein [Yersinia rochesterensis]UZM74494.1 outer membrane beta-barrel protein [Yersinia sp. SCPM-O-B-9106 (C-191)]
MLGKLVLVSVIGLSFSSLASAESKNTLSFGYAQSGNTKFKNKSINGNSPEQLKGKPDGINIKYRYEFDNKFGVIASLTKLYSGTDYLVNNKVIARGHFDYTSLQIGPTYRLNEYISAYVMGGIASYKLEGEDYRDGYVESQKARKKGFGYALGLQINPIENIAIDTSYEQSKSGDFKSGVWSISAGYRF